MKKNKNQVTLLLIISSIVLLLALQALWLTNSYEQAYFDIRRETNGLFRSTIFAMRDSLFTQRISPLYPDSVNQAITPDRVEKLPDSASQVRIYINAQNIKADTVSTLLRPIAGRLHMTQFLQGRSFVIRMTPDSLSLDSIQYQFSRTLEQNNVDVHFTVQTAKDTPPQMDFRPGRFRMAEAQWEDSLTKRIYSNLLYSDWVRFDPAHRYSVILSGIRPLLLKQITPQILFSLFLTIITTAAFGHNNA